MVQPSPPFFRAFAFLQQGLQKTTGHQRMLGTWVAWARFRQLGRGIPPPSIMAPYRSKTLFFWSCSVGQYTTQGAQRLGMESGGRKQPLFLFVQAAQGEGRLFLAHRHQLGTHLRAARSSSRAPKDSNIDEGPRRSGKRWPWGRPMLVLEGEFVWRSYGEISKGRTSKKLQGTTAIEFDGQTVWAANRCVFQEHWLVNCRCCSSCCSS